MDDIRDAFGPPGLWRAPDDHVFGGVATGLGRRLGLDPPAVGRARRPAREHVLPATGPAVKPVHVRPDVEGIVT